MSAISGVCHTARVVTEVRLACSESREALTARLKSALAPPVSTAVEDALNRHMTARPGEQRLTGRFEGDQLAVWRRGSGSWVGLNRFVGQVHGDESGAELVGRMRLRRIAIASYVLLILGAALMVGVAAGHAPPSSSRRCLPVQQPPASPTSLSRRAIAGFCLQRSGTLSGALPVHAVRSFASD